MGSQVGVEVSSKESESVTRVGKIEDHIEIR